MAAGSGGDREPLTRPFPLAALGVSAILSALRGARDSRHEFAECPSPRLRGEGAAKRRMRGYGQSRQRNHQADRRPRNVHEVEQQQRNRREDAADQHPFEHAPVGIEAAAPHPPGSRDHDDGDHREAARSSVPSQPPRHVAIQSGRRADRNMS